MVGSIVAGLIRPVQRLTLTSETIMALEKGSKAPNFTLKRKTQEGLEDVSLQDGLQRKQVVLLFFPLAFTGVCTDEFCTVSQGIDAYAGLDAEVFGISVDSPFAQEAWAQQNEITVPLLSDFDRSVAKSYDVLYEELLGLKGVAKRSAFVIGRDGTIEFSWSSDDPHDLPDFDALKAALKN